MIGRFFGVLNFLFIAVLSLAPSVAAHRDSVPAMASHYSGTCAAPPPNFNFLHATQAELTYYGLPPRPTGNGLLHWLDVVSHSKTRICDPGTLANIATLPSKRVNPMGSSGSPYAYNDTWSGYIVDQGGMDEAFSDWQIPCGQRSPNGSTVVSWVGLGGFYNENLWQAGTTEDPSDGYFFWYEAYPLIQAVKLTNNRLYCGDTVAVDVNYNISCSNGVFAWMEDYTHYTYQTSNNGNCLSFTPDLNTADWIDERPTFYDYGVQCHTTLYDFVNVNWSDVAAYSTWYYNNYMTLIQYNDLMIEMTDNGSSSSTRLAEPGQVNSNNGSSFTDIWYNAGTNTCT